MTGPHRKQRPTLRIAVRASSAPELQHEIGDSLRHAGVELETGLDLLTYEGPPPGAFGFGAGWLEVATGAWQELVRLPKAVEAVAEGIAKWMNKERVNASVERRPDGTVVINFLSSGGQVDTDTLLAKLTTAISGESAGY